MRLREALLWRGPRRSLIYDEFNLVLVDMHIAGLLLTCYCYHEGEWKVIVENANILRESSMIYVSI